VKYNSGSNRASNFKLGRARSVSPIWNYKHDYTWNWTFAWSVYISKFQLDLDVRHLSPEPLARVIAQALPVLDVKFTFTFTDTVISLYRGRFHVRCAKNSWLYWEYRYIEDRYIGVLSHTFFCNFWRDIAYLSLHRGYRYIEDRCIGVPLYKGATFDFDTAKKDKLPKNYRRNTDK